MLARKNYMIKVFEGSYIDGCSVDIVSWCGLELTDQQHDSLLNAKNETDLLEEAGAEVQIEYAAEELPPGMNDTWYSVYCDDIDAFKASLRSTILQLVK
jgi:hypothetical protein